MDNYKEVVALSPSDNKASIPGLGLVVGAFGFITQP